jgi:hypothetical protein
MKASPLILLILWFTVGCSPVETRTYSLTVRNDSSKTVICWLTKNGPAYGEPGWKSPEDLAIEKPSPEDPFGFQTTPPGRTAELKSVIGHFAPGADAVLRVYVGQRSFNEILAMSRDSPDRLEVVLRPGPNALVVINDSSAVAGVQVQRLAP